MEAFQRALEFGDRQIGPYDAKDIADIINKYDNDGTPNGFRRVDGMVQGSDVVISSPHRGKMINDLYANEIDSPYYYVYYYDENYNRTTALSKLDENNLKSLANDLKIDYIQMNKQKNVDYKLNDIKKKLVSIEKNEKDMKVYNDIYFYFAIPLIIVLFVDFINKKRRIQ